MLAVWFANPMMLGGLALVALPVLIHLLFRRRPVPMDWGAMRYLRLAMQRQSRRMRLEQWLLLALRCLIIAMAALAAAQPYWQPAAVGGAARPPVFHVVVMDCSLSMQAAAADGRTVFDQARDAAVTMLDRGGERDRWCLVRLDVRRPRVLVDAEVASAALVRRRLQELEPGFGAADVAETLAETLRLLRAAPRGFERRVTVFSDFQRTNWLPAATADRQRIRAVLVELGGEADVALHPVSAVTRNNLAIAGWQASRTLAFAGRTVEVTVRVRNGSERPRAGVPVRLRVGDAWQPGLSTDLPPQGTAEVTFRFRVSQPGPLPLRAELPEDVLPADNRAFAALSVQQQARVLLVDGRFGEPPRSRSAFFVRQALEPAGDSSRLSPFRVTVIPDSQLPLTDLSEFDAVFVCDVPLWTAAEAERLRQFVRGGGALIVVLGTGARAESVNRHLWQGDPPLLAGRLVGLHRPAAEPGTPSERSDGDTAGDGGGQTAHAAGAFLFGPIRWEHPVFEPLRGNEQTGLETVVVLAYWRLQPDAQSEALVRLLNDAPLLLVRQAGRGRIATLACGLDASSTSWPIWGSSFVPIMHELTAWCIAGRRQRLAYRVGETLEVVGLRTPSASDVPAAATEGALRIVPPQPDPAVPLPLPRSPDVPIRWSRTWRPGFYRIAEPSGRTVELFGVNVDVREADLADDLAGVRRVLEESRRSSPSRAAPDASPTEPPFPWPLLLATVGLLLVEQLVRWDVRYGVIGLCGLLATLAILVALWR